jgi:hypothetical protein
LLFLFLQGESFFETQRTQSLDDVLFYFVITRFMRVIHDLDDMDYPDEPGNDGGGGD